MVNFEKGILEHVRQHPGCGRGTFDTIKHSDAAEEADRMVSAGKLDRWYSGTVPAYYIPGTYTPPHLIADTDGTQEGVIPLAAELHRDGIIHIYVKEKDSGLSVGLGDAGTLWVRVDESKRSMVVKR